MGRRRPWGPSDTKSLGMRADFVGDYEGSLFKKEFADAFDKVLEQIKGDLIVADPLTR